ncbi:MAG: glutathione S-transferase family protein [Panacagrimonas sp.]
MRRKRNLFSEGVKSMVRLYGFSGSGNCWKPAAVMEMLGTVYEWVETDILAGQSRTPEFLTRNPNGRVPLLEVQPGRYLAESNAMLCYLAQGSALLPQARYEQAKVLEWLFFEQYSHEPYIATVRFWVHYLHKRDEWREKIAEAMTRGHAALGVMESQLVRTPFLAGDACTIADIALFAYTHVADEGGYELSGYPAVQAWITRMLAQPGFKPMRA